MASPVGHYLLGLTITQAFARNEKERKRGIWLSTIAILPDLDLIPGLLFAGDPWEFHRLGSHSITVGALFALTIMVILLRWRSERPLQLSALVFIVYSSHFVFDFFTFDSGQNAGVPLLWPWLSNPFQSPFTLIPGGRFASEHIYSLSNIILVMWEMVILLPLAGLIYTLKASRMPRPRFAAWFYGGVFLTALLASAYVL